MKASFWGLTLSRRGFLDGGGGGGGGRLKGGGMFCAVATTSMHSRPEFFQLLLPRERNFFSRLLQSRTASGSKSWITKRQIRSGQQT